MKRITGILGGAAVAALAVGGCSAGYESSPSADWDEAQFESAGAVEDLGYDGEATSRDSAEVVSQVIMSGDATILTSDPSAGADEFIADIKGMGGVIENAWQQDRGSAKSASVSVTVPADKFDAALALLDSYGKIEDKNLYREDVGQQIADLDARRAALEDSLKRLTSLMDEAADLSDLLAAEEMRTERQGELDSLNAQLEWLSQQVARSSLTVTFTTSQEITSGFTFAKAWELLTDSVLFLAYALVILIPWVGFVWLVVWLVIRLARKASRKKKARVKQPSEATQPGIPVQPNKDPSTSENRVEPTAPAESVEKP